MKRRKPRILMMVMALVLSAGISAVAQGALNKRVELVAGKAETISLPQAAADILVANPAIADVGSLRADRLFVVGRNVGDTNVLAFDSDGNQLADIAVHVRVDKSTLSQSLRELFPKEKIDVDTVNNSIILRGRVSSPAVANQVRDLASRFVAQGGNQTLVDLMTVRGEMQVMLKVKVIEIKRDLLREIGLDLDGQVTIGANNWATLGVTTIAGAGLSALTPFGGGSLGLIQKGHLGPLDINMQGLEDRGLINTLAEPTLTAISGETAGFLAGGEFPVPTGRDQDGNITLEFKQFGVSLNFIPTVLDSKRISLQLTSEVSEKSEADSITLINTIIPGLTVSRAQTTVQMGSGGTLMIAGLLKSRTVDSVNGLPGFQDIPIIGELFKSKSFQRGESELVFLVTPYLVEPFADPSAERLTEADDELLQEILQTGTTTTPMPVRAERPVNPANPGVVPNTRPVMEMKKSGGNGRTYQRQGAEPRSAGMKKAEAKKIRWFGDKHVQTAAASEGWQAMPVEQAAAEPALKIPRQGLMLPVEGGDKQAMIDDLQHLLAKTLPLPKRKPVMGEKKLAAKLPVKEETAKPVVTGRLQPVEQAPLAPVTTLAVSESVKRGAVLAAVSAPLPKRKPQQAAAKGLSEHAKAEAKQAAEKTELVTAPAPKAEKAAKPARTTNAAKPAAVEKGERALSATFVSGLRKIYGNRVSATLGAERSYGYIVD